MRARISHALRPQPNIDFSPDLGYVEGMKKSVYIVSAAILSLSFASVAAACEYHGGYGTFKSRWDNYTPSQSYTDDAASFDSNQASAPVAKQKPVFSNAASRASNIAKARVERKADAETKVDAEAEAKTQDISVTKTASR